MLCVAAHRTSIRNRRENLVATTATTATIAPEASAKKPKKKIQWSTLPQIWALIHPRRGLLLIGFALMAINRVAGLILPGSTKYLVDDVIGKRQVKLLVPIVLAVIGAAIVQGLTSFPLTQLLSKSAQRMITDLRKQVRSEERRVGQE